MEQKIQKLTQASPRTQEMIQKRRHQNNFMRSVSLDQGRMLGWLKKGLRVVDSVKGQAIDPPGQLQKQISQAKVQRHYTKMCEYIDKAGKKIEFERRQEQFRSKSNDYVIPIKRRDNSSARMDNNFVSQGKVSGHKKIASYMEEHHAGAERQFDAKPRRVGYRDEFIYDQQRSLKELDFKQSQLYVYYDKKYKLIERRTSSLQRQHDLTWGVRQQLRNSEVRQLRQDNNYEDQYINLHNEEEYHFEMSKANVSKYLVYKLPLFGTFKRLAHPLSLQKMQDFLVGCEIVVEQALGNINFQKADQDQFKVGQDVMIIQGEKVKQFYISKEYETRTRFANQLRKLTVFQQNRQKSIALLQDQMRKQRQQSLLNKIKNGRFSSEFKQGAADSFDLNELDEKGMEHDEMADFMKDDFINVFITLTSCSDKCKGVVKFKNQIYSKSTIHQILSGQVEDENQLKVTSDAYSYVTKQIFDKVGLPPEQIKIDMRVDLYSDFMNVTCYRRSLQDVDQYQRRQKKELPRADVKSKAQSMLEKLAIELRKRVNNQLMSNQSKSTLLNEMQNLTQRISTLDNLCQQFVDLGFKQEAPPARVEEEQVRRVSVHRSGRHRRHPEAVKPRTALQSFFEDSLKLQRRQDVMRRQSMLGEFEEIMKHLSVQEETRIFQREVMVKVQELCRKIRTEKLFLICWIALIQTSVIMKTLRTKKNVMRAFMSKQLQQMLAVKFLQRQFRRRLEFFKVGAITIHKTDPYNQALRLYNYHYKLIVCSITSTDQFMHHQVKRDCTKIVSDFLMKKTSQLGLAQGFGEKLQRMIGLITMCQRRFRRAATIYRKRLLDRVMQLQFTIEDLYPDWLVERMSKATLKANMQNKLATQKNEEILLQNIKEMNKQQMNKDFIQEKIRQSVGSKVTRFDQLYLKKMYFERLQSSINGQMEEMKQNNGKLNPTQMSSIKRQMQIIKTENTIVTNELNAYFHGQDRIHRDEVEPEESPFTLKRNYKQHHGLNSKPKGNEYPWEDVIKLRKEHSGKLGFMKHISTVEPAETADKSPKKANENKKSRHQLTLANYSKSERSPMKVRKFDSDRSHQKAKRVPQEQQSARINVNQTPSPSDAKKPKKESPITKLEKSQFVPKIQPKEPVAYNAMYDSRVRAKSFSGNQDNSQAQKNQKQPQLEGLLSVKEKVDRKQSGKKDRKMSGKKDRKMSGKKDNTHTVKKDNEKPIKKDDEIQLNKDQKIELPEMPAQRQSRQLELNRSNYSKTKSFQDASSPKPVQSIPEGRTQLTTKKQSISSSVTQQSLFKADSSLVLNNNDNKLMIAKNKNNFNSLWEIQSTQSKQQMHRESKKKDERFQRKLEGPLKKEDRPQNTPLAKVQQSQQKVLSDLNDKIIQNQQQKQRIKIDRRIRGNQSDQLGDVRQEHQENSKIQNLWNNKLSFVNQKAEDPSANANQGQNTRQPRMRTQKGTNSKSQQFIGQSHRQSFAATPMGQQVSQNPTGSNVKATAHTSRITGGSIRDSPVSTAIVSPQVNLPEREKEPDEVYEMYDGQIQYIHSYPGVIDSARRPNLKSYSPHKKDMPSRNALIYGESSILNNTSSISSPQKSTVIADRFVSPSIGDGINYGVWRKVLKDTRSTLICNHNHKFNIMKMTLPHQQEATTCPEELRHSKFVDQKSKNNQNGKY